MHGLPKPPTAVSAPGKVLLAGGYLVLDRAYTGLVFGLNARITVVASEIETSHGVQLTEIAVESPQFLDAQWRYGYHLADEDGGIKVTQLQIGAHFTPNSFVETTLSYALTYIGRVAHHRPSHSIRPARITILADNDYYSNPAAPATAAPTAAAAPAAKPPSTTSSTAAAPSPSSSSSSATPPASSINAASASRAAAGVHAVPTSVSGRRYARFPTTLAKAHKTGLGSSAALVTALTAALLTHYLPTSLFDLSSDAGRTTLHNLAQAAHCAAQGKVGSGFDVAAAVYGSCRYRRFSPGIVASLPDAGSPGFATALERCVAGGRREPGDGDGDGAGQRWDTEVAKDGVRLPAGVAVRMCDVDCGSQTVGMVKGVLAWRGRDAAAAKALWDELQERNDRLAAVLRDGSTADIRAATRAVRELVRKMGAESDVPIEPESQTALLDALEGVEGVFGGVVPGAGGYDALALLVRDDAETARRIEAFVEEWAKTKAGKVRLLGVKGEMDGVRAENVAEYQEWI